MSDNFFKVKNGLNLPTLANDPTLSPPNNSAVGDMAVYNNEVYVRTASAWEKMPAGPVTTSEIAAGAVTDNEVSNTAAIAGTKVNPNFGSQNIQTSGTISTTGTGTITAAGTLIANSQLQVNANSSSEAVFIRQRGSGNALVVEDDASVTPDTTSTVIDSSGNLGVGVSPASALTEKITVAGNVKLTSGDVLVDSAKGIESSSAASTLNVGTGTNTQTLNLGTGSGTQTVNIGTGSGTTTINIGGTGDTVVVSGTLTTVNTTNLDVADKNITINKGGTDATAAGAGITVEGTSGASRATLQYDSALTSKFKLGASGSEAEVVTVSDAQTLSNKTVGTLIAQSGTLSLTGTGALKIPVGTAAQQPAGVQGMIRYDTTASAFQGYDGTTWSSIGGATTIKRITQASHGFSVGQVLYLNGSTYALAKADVAATAEVAGMVSRVIDASTFELTICGEVSGLSSLTVGENYFLSPSSAGAITATEPTVVGQISLPVGVASSATTLLFKALRGAVVGGANVRTQIALANNATTNVQNVSAYEAGELTGWVTISATTPLRFFVRAAFARNGAASDYNLSYQTTGDTPPAGFSMGITAAGVITATLPTISGYSTASINFALNAPAVGATLPLQISGGNVTGPVLGSTSGAAPAAGYVGEVKESIITTGNVTGSTTAGTFTDLSHNIILGVGVWDLTAFGSFFTNTCSGVGIAGRIVRAQIWNSTDNSEVISNLSGITQAAKASEISFISLNKSFVVTSGTKTITVRFTTIENSTVTTLGSLSAYAQNGLPQVLKAVRIA